MISQKKAELAKLKGTGLQNIVNEACKILGNPVLVYDTSYNLLVITEGVVTDDWVWNEIATTKTFCYETVKFFYAQKFFTIFAESDVVSHLYSEELKYDRYTGKLFDVDNVQVANVTIVECYTPFQEGDAILLEFLSDLLSTELQKSPYLKKIDRVFKKTLFDTLLDGGYMSSEMKAEFDQINENAKDYKYIGVVDISQRDETITHLAYFRDLFKKLQPEFHYYIYLNNIVIIMSTDSKLININKDLSALDEFFKRNKINCGLSCAFDSFVDIKKHFKQALNALNYGLKTPRIASIYRYDEFRLEHYAHLKIDATVLKEMKNSIVSAIEEHDERHNTQLAKTLYCYLSYGRNIALTCQALNITQPELRKDLKILEKTFNLDWTNGDMLCNIFIHLSLQNV